MNTIIQTEMLRIAANAALRGYVIGGKTIAELEGHHQGAKLLNAAFEPLGMADKFDPHIRDHGKIYVRVGQVGGHFPVDKETGAVGEFIVTMKGNLLKTA
jgi:hypothetical protein